MQVGKEYRKVLRDEVEDFEWVVDRIFADKIKTPVWSYLRIPVIDKTRGIYQVVRNKTKQQL
jgi:hypothetical protein